METTATSATDADVPREERRRDYELLLVLRSGATPQERDRVLEKFRHLLSDNGGELIEAGMPKNQQFAYPVKKERQGTYISFVFRADTTMPKRIFELLQHEPLLLRHMITERQKIRRKTSLPSFSAERSVTTPEPDAEKRMEEQIEAALKLSK